MEDYELEQLDEALGEVIYVQARITCPYCEGYKSHKCDQCKGTGYMHEDVSLEALLAILQKRKTMEV